MVSECRLSDFFKELTGELIRVSEATIEKFNKEASLKVNIDAIKQELLNGNVMHVDETLLRSVQLLEYDSDVPRTSKGCSFDATVRVHSNATTTLYTVNPHKDDNGVERDGIIPLFCGILSHDHDKKYYKYGNFHATCGVHLCRELKGLYELYGIEWAYNFRKFYVGMNDYKNRMLICEAGKLLEFEVEYDKLVCDGYIVLNGLKKDSYVYKQLIPILNCLKRYKDLYMLFIRNYCVPSNNCAERDLRPCKMKREVSGCFRSWAGVVCYAIIRSFLSTAHKRKENLFSAVKQLFLPPSVCPAEQ